MKDKNKPRVRKPKPLLEPVPEDGNSKFARALASTDYHTREKGLQALTRWLQLKGTMLDLDMLKSPTPITLSQEELADRLAGILQNLPAEMAVAYFAGFIRIMKREWFGIDRLRLDKFMMLVRRFFSQLFLHLKKQDWDLATTMRCTEVLQQELLLPSEPHRALGLVYHIADLFIPELKEAVAEGAAPPHACLLALLQPFCATLQQSKDKIKIGRIKEAVFDVVVEEAAHPSEPGVVRRLDVAKFSTHLFEMGAEPTVKVHNREVLYGLSKALDKACRKRAKTMGQELPAAQPAAAVAGRDHSTASASRQQPPADTGAETTISVSATAATAGLSKKARKALLAAVAAAAAAPPTQPAESKANGMEAAGTKKEKRRGRSAAAAEPGPDLDEAAASIEPEPSAAAEPPSKKKQKKRKARDGAATEGEAAEVSQASVPDAATPQGTASADKKRKRRQAADAAAAPAAAAEAPVPAPGGSAEATKAHGKKAKASPGDALAPAPGGSVEATIEATKSKGKKAKASGDTPAPATHNGVEAKKPKGKKAKASPGGPQQEAAPEAAPRPSPQPASLPGTPQRKKVKINLKHNLYFAPGSPPPAPDVRTPISARSKGSILKIKAPPASAGRLGGPRRGGGGGRAGAVAGGNLMLSAGVCTPAGQAGGKQGLKQGAVAPGSAPAALQSQAGGRNVTPNSFPRAKAENFFFF